MKKVLLALFVLASAPASAQSVCQTRWFGGGFWAAASEASDVWGKTTFNPRAFTFEYPGEEGAAEVVAWSAHVPTRFLGGKEYAWSTDGVNESLIEVVQNGLEFGAYYVKESGAYTGPYAAGAVGLKLTTQHDAWRTAVTNKGYSRTVFVETWTLVRVCGNETQLLLPSK